MSELSSDQQGHIEASSFKAPVGPEGEDIPERVSGAVRRVAQALDYERKYGRPSPLDVDDDVKALSEDDWEKVEKEARLIDAEPGHPNRRGA